MPPQDEIGHDERLRLLGSLSALYHQPFDAGQSHRRTSSRRCTNPRALGLKTVRINTAIGLNLTTEAQAEFEQEVAL